MLEKYYPDLIVERPWNIDLSVLSRNGVKGVVLDIDNTLVPHFMKDASPEAIQWIQGLKDQGFKVCIVSNASRKRVERFNREIKIDATHRASKPGVKALVNACRRMGLQTSEAAVVGDQVFTDILGGNRLNMFTVLVKPMHTKELFFIKFKRVVERYILRRHGENFKAIQHKRKTWKERSAHKRLRRGKNLG